ncbi:DUF624 domain-containing protein [Pisciglobus halotolerans]|uniref:Uncharacterized membrane protein YesL n=1 Tax=Pisciglobus halotolerans TaxID=745365 RepID=A0A1I3B2P5_9LACT|nr:DUF624 domain-containing protein [Pisciglobus halotolerans]SFH56543.1 Uncharacterized membrane protein YesL [Pisciglobus halotolerans]
MVGKGLTDLFNRIYYLIKLSLFFWSLSATGLFIAGAIPAWIALLEAHKEAQWQAAEVSWSACWAIYKTYFKPGLLLLLFFASIWLLMAWNLFLSVQIKGLLFLIIDFLLVALLLLSILTFLISTGLFVEYEILFWNAVKLAFLQIFLTPRDAVAIVIGMSILSFLTYHFPGLLVFLSIGMGIAVVQTSTKKIAQKIDAVM